MHLYEIIFIVHPDLDENALTEVVDKVKGWITDAGGNISKIDLWGRRHLAYAIRKQREGQYVLVQAEMAPAFGKELDRNMRFLEPIMRFSIVAI